VDAFMNAIKVDMAIAGSANLILHIPAIANEAGLDLPWWKYFDEISNEVPLLSHLAPGGEYNLKDLDMAGGMPALMNALLPKLNGDCMTVNGKTVRENVQNAKIYMPDVIRTLDNPVSTEPGIGVLYGNIAPEGAILKIAAVPEQLMTYRGPAHVFNSLQEGLDALHAGQVKSGEACVLRFLGLKARFGTTAFPFQEDLKGMSDLFDTCAIITDGRYSGGTSGLSVGYVSPEAALGSPLAIIEDGDMIEIDIPNSKITLKVSDEELAKRKAEWQPREPKITTGYLARYAKLVTSGAQGAVLN
jgi:dihydroxy-acid dehydratase